MMVEGGVRDGRGWLCARVSGYPRFGNYGPLFRTLGHERA